MVKRLYPELPVLSAGAIIFRDDSVLLVKRGREPAKGLWSIPGGVIKVGEHILKGLAREVMEETGVQVGIKELVEVVERIFKDEEGRITYHYVILDYFGEYINGTAKAASDADEAVFVPAAEIRKYHLTDGLLDVIFKANSMRKSKHSQTSEDCL